MVALIVFAIIFAILGIVGSVVPGLPGPPLSWVGMLLAYFAGRVGDKPDPMATGCLLAWLAVTVIVDVPSVSVPESV